MGARAPIDGPLIAVEGPSRVGKSSIVREVGTLRGWPIVREAFDLIDPPPSLDFRSGDELLAIEARLVEEESRRYLEARRLAAHGQPVLLDTGFFGPLTYTIGLRTLGLAPATAPARVAAHLRRRWRRRAWGVPDAHVWLSAPSTTLSRRWSRSPNRPPRVVVERHWAVARVERRVLAAEVRPRMPSRVAFLPADGPIARTGERLARFAASIAPLAESHRLSGELLSRLSKALVSSGNR